MGTKRESVPEAWWLRGLVTDLRSLALFRIALGAVLAVDLLLRIPQIPQLYTDAGVLPREALLRFSGRPLIGLHLLSGQWSVQLLLFGVALLFAIGLMAGYRTRLCAVVSWALLLSMHARNPFVLHGGDAVLRLLLFWSMFAPLNQRWALDRALNPDAPVLPVRHLSPASLALVFQVCGIYWFAAAAKMHPSWLGDQSAVYYALSLDQFATPIGRTLLDFPAILRAMTTGTILLEMLGPILAISPVFTVPLRLVIPGSFIGFHLGLALTMWLDLFPWVCIAAWLAFLPSALWDRLATLKFPRFSAPTRWAAALRPPPPRAIGLAGSVLVLALLVLVTASFVDAVPGGRRSFPRRFLWLTMMDQSWKMFSPAPSSEDGWFVIEGWREDGKSFDLWNGGGPPTDAKPASFRTTAYPNTQWLAWLTGLRNYGRRDYFPYFGRYLCHRWNDHRAASDHIRLVAIRYMVELTPPPGKPATGAVPEVVWLQPCIT